MNGKRLLVIVPDRVSDILKKGEYPSRYYNPGELFDDVHLLMTNDDQPDGAALQKTVGHAQLHLHNLPIPSFWRTLGWRTAGFRKWLETGVTFASKVHPDVVRAHGAFQNGFLAAQIKKHNLTPLIVSLHINPDVDIRGRLLWRSDWKNSLVYWRMKEFEKETLRTADRVLPVYEPIRPYAERLGARNVQICYNALNGDNLRKKTSYQLSGPPRIISVGRQFKEKNPDNLIRAITHLEEATLTIVGDGSYHDDLKKLARECHISNRVIFYKAVPNDELCRMLPNFDIFATHTEYWELNKCVLEALLTGLPVVLNRRSGPAVPELQGDFLLFVENTSLGYYQALKNLIDNPRLREELGSKAYGQAQKHWAPEKAEAKFADVYQELLKGS